MTSNLTTSRLHFFLLPSSQRAWSYWYHRFFYFKLWREIPCRGQNSMWEWWDPSRSILFHGLNYIFWVYLLRRSFSPSRPFHFSVQFMSITRETKDKSKKKHSLLVIVAVLFLFFSSFFFFFFFNFRTFDPQANPPSSLRKMSSSEPTLFDFSVESTTGAPFPLSSYRESDKKAYLIVNVAR